MGAGGLNQRNNLVGDLRWVVLVLIDFGKAQREVAQCVEVGRRVWMRRRTHVQKGLEGRVQAHAKRTEKGHLGRRHTQTPRGPREFWQRDEVFEIVDGQVEFVGEDALDVSVNTSAVAGSILCERKERGNAQALPFGFCELVADGGKVAHERSNVPIERAGKDTRKYNGQINSIAHAYFGEKGIGNTTQRVNGTREVGEERNGGEVDIGG